MSYLTYIEPPGLPDEIEVGALVEVCDRTGTGLSLVHVKKVTKNTIRTDDGRMWDRRGWWRGARQSWPFPFIRVPAFDQEPGNGS